MVMKIKRRRQFVEAVTRWQKTKPVLPNAICLVNMTNIEKFDAAIRSSAVRDSYTRFMYKLNTMEHDRHEGF